VRPSTTADWAKRLMKLGKPSKEEDPTSGLISITRLVGDRQLDVDDEVRSEVSAFLEKLGVGDEMRAALTRVVEVDQGGESAAFGENLPAGLRLS
jgi:hypothetical protein